MLSMGYYEDIQRNAPYLLVKRLQSELSVTEIAAKINFMLRR